MRLVTSPHPQRVGDLLDRAFQRYRTHFVTLVSIVALPLVPLTIIRLLLFASPQAATIFDWLRDLVVVNLVILQ